MFDAYPNDAGNILDTDGDGVADRFDVFPNDATKTKAVVVDLDGAESLGLGEALAKQGGSAQLLPPALRMGKPQSENVLAMLFPKAYAAGEAPSISNLTNAIAWDEEGQALNDSILSSQTLFIAEAGLTPDGRFLYLLPVHTCNEPSMVLMMRCALFIEWIWKIMVSNVCSPLIWGY